MSTRRIIPYPAKLHTLGAGCLNAYLLLGKLSYARRLIVEGDLNNTDDEG